MKKFALSIVLVFASALGVTRFADAGPEPSVGLFWYETVDPTIAPGVCAPQWQLLIRTDVPSLYAHTGASCTAWLLIAGGSGGGTVTSVTCGTGLTCTPNPITHTGTIAADGTAPTGAGTLHHITAWSGASSLTNALGGATDDGTTYTVPDSVFAATGQAQLGNEALAILSPSSISATVNDWSPTGWTGKTTTIIEVALSASANLNGLVALNTGATVSLCNMSTSFDLTINDENAGSTAANRFENQGGLITLNHHAGPEPECATYYYSGSQSRWINRAATASTIHSLTVTSGFNVASSGATINGGLSVAAAYSGVTGTTSTVSSTSTGTANTTAGGVQLNGINCSNTVTRSAGANNLTNVCGQFTASGGQVNDAIVTLAGNNVFNQSSGTSTFDGNLIMGAAGAVIQLIQAADGSATPKITAYAGNPNTHVACTAGDFLLDTSTPAIWQCTGGSAWAQGGAGGSVVGTGTSPDLTVWTGTNTVSSYAGSTASACTVGQFVTQAALSAAGTLTTTCTSGGGAGTITGSGTAGNLTEWLSSSAVQNAPITDNGTGTLATTGTFTTGQLNLTGKTSDTSTGTVNNFNIPTGSSGTSVLRAAPGTAVTYTGFECGGSTCSSANDGLVLVLYDAGATGVTLSNENASSTAANRIWAQNNVSITLSGNASNPNTAAILVYDGTSTRWRVVATNQVIWTAAVTMSATLATTNGITVSGSRLNLSTGASRVADTATGPTLTSCGATPSPTVTTGEGKFTITTGGSATGCVATFATAFSNTPTCTVTSQSGTPAAYTTSSSAVTLGSGTAASTKYDVDCTDH